MNKTYVYKTLATVQTCMNSFLLLLQENTQLKNDFSYKETKSCSN